MRRRHVVGATLVAVVLPTSVIPALRRGYLVALGTNDWNRLSDWSERVSAGSSVDATLREIPAPERENDELNM